MHILDRLGFSLMKRSWRRSAGTIEDGQRERGTRSRNRQRQRTRARRSAERGTHEARTDTRRRRSDLSGEGQRKSKDGQRNGTPDTPRGIDCTEQHEIATAEAMPERRQNAAPDHSQRERPKPKRGTVDHAPGGQTEIMNGDGRNGKR